METFELEATKAPSFYITVDHKYSYRSSSRGDVQLLNWGDCVIRSGSSFGWANYTRPIVKRGVPLRLQLLQVSEASAALPSIWTIPFLLDKQCTHSVLRIWEYHVHQMFVSFSRILFKHHLHFPYSGQFLKIILKVRAAGAAIITKEQDKLLPTIPTMPMYYKFTPYS